MVKEQNPTLIDINFNPKLFNKIYWRIKALFDNVAIRFIFIYGGSSASKTFSVVQRIITLMLESKDENTLVLRKYSTDIRDSIFADFKGVIRDWGLEEEFTINQNFIICSTGSFVRFRGLDDSEKVKGVSQFKRVVLEEINQFDHDDFKQVKKRLRGRKGQQIIGIFNPIRHDHWIKKQIIDLEKWVNVETTIAEESINDKGNFALLRTNHLDNRWIVGPDFVDQHVLDDFEHDRIHDENAYRVYGLGLWGYPRTGHECYHSFRSNIHVKPIKFDPEINVHLSFDFNTVPYMTLICCQIRNEDGRWKVRFFREYCLSNPFNSTKSVCQAFAKDYPAFQNRVFYYGDYSGKNNRIDDDLHRFQIVEKELRRWLNNSSDRVIVNPSVMRRIRFVNAILEGRLPMDIEIDQRCEKLIEDLSYVLQAPDGGKHKKKVMDQETKVSYEERGHTSDALEYLLCSAFSDQFELYK